tara:strand:- start:72 stop:203 length:132 start_codon:yes stop_codon:yes gene_type:complete
MSHGGSKMLAKLKKRRAKKLKRKVGTPGVFGTTFVTKKPKTTA